MNSSELVRFNLYIDGFNLYYKLKEAKDLDAKNQKTYWLDLNKFGLWLGGLLPPTFQFHQAKFFTSPAESNHSYRNQADYWKALSTKPTVVRFDGEFKKKTVRCKVDEPHCGKKFSYQVLSEKRTDVCMGVEMVADSLEGAIGAIIVVTRDIDQVPSLQKIKDRRPSIPRILAFPPGDEPWPEALVALASDVSELKGLVPDNWPKPLANRCREGLVKGKLVLEPSIADLISCRLPPHVKVQVPQGKSKASPRYETVEEPEDWRRWSKGS